MQRYQLHLHDELYPHVKSGHRIVVARIGWKWVHLKEASAESYTRWKRIARKKWDQFKKEKLND